ncbi:S-layer homology domain-containing protein [Paenibacillus sp. FSL H8-0537]|uniref:S-layer homology domain-containing protein n=1 Tax=Paenibacillus sp. FSL H8-0537 TaxID=2921399 RepID=UPI003100D71F
MKKKPLLLTLILTMMMLTIGQSAWAFNDVKNDPNAKKIEALQQQGIITGDKNGNFRPQGNLTYAEGISMIVKGLELNFDHIRFVKQPLAADYYTNIKDDKWYSQAFIIAHFYDLGVAKDVKANDVMTREQFAQHLFKAIDHKVTYAMIEMYVMLNDEADVNPDFMGNIQKLLLSKIATLDAKQNFYPTASIKRGDAAAWLHDGIAFMKKMKEIEAPVSQPEPSDNPFTDARLTVTAVNAEVNKVTVTATVPHPGYGIQISGITFDGDQATITLERTEPKPDQMYAQVITEVQVTTYVDAKFKPVLPAASVAFQGSSTAAPAGSNTSVAS